MAFNGPLGPLGSPKSFPATDAQSTVLMLQVQFCEQSLGIPYIKSPKKAKIHRFFKYVFDLFPNIWPLAGPNIAKKGLAVTKIGEGGSTNPFWDF